LNFFKKGDGATTKRRRSDDQTFWNQIV
jgi:hypothetical protein